MMRVPINPKSLEIAEQEKKKKEAELSQSALHRLSELPRFDLVGAANRKAIDARLKRTLGTPGPLLSTTSKFK